MEGDIRTVEAMLRCGVQNERVMRSKIRDLEAQD